MPRLVMPYAHAVKNALFGSNCYILQIDYEWRPSKVGQCGPAMNMRPNCCS